MKSHLISSAGCNALGPRSTWRVKSPCSDVREPKLLAVMALQGSSPPKAVKVSLRVSLLTLLEPHGKGIYPIAMLDMLWTWRAGQKTYRPTSFVCNCFRALKLPWRGLAGLYLPALYQELQKKPHRSSLCALAWKESLVVPCLNFPI